VDISHTVVGVEVVDHDGLEDLVLFISLALFSELGFLQLLEIPREHQTIILFLELGFSLLPKNGQVDFHEVDVRGITDEHGLVAEDLAKPIGVCVHLPFFITVLVEKNSLYAFEVDPDAVLHPQPLLVEVAEDVELAGLFIELVHGVLPLVLELLEVEAVSLVAQFSDTVALVLGYYALVVVSADGH